MSATSLVSLFDSVKITEHSFVSEADAGFVEATQKEYLQIIAGLEAWLQGIEQLAAKLGDSVYKILEINPGYGRRELSYSVDTDYEKRNWMDRRAFSTAYSRKYIHDTISSLKAERNQIIADYFKKQYNITFDIPSENCQEPWDVVKMIMKVCKGGSLVDLGIVQVKERFISDFHYRDEPAIIQKNKLIISRVYIDYRSGDKTLHLKNAIVLFETGSINPINHIHVPQLVSGEPIQFTGTTKILSVKAFKNLKFEMVFASNAEVLAFAALFQINVQ